MCVKILPLHLEEFSRSWLKWHKEIEHKHELFITATCRDLKNAYTNVYLTSLSFRIDLKTLNEIPLLYDR